MLQRDKKNHFAWTKCQAKLKRNGYKVTEKITLFKKIQVSSTHIKDDSINEINVSMVTKHKVQQYEKIMFKVSYIKME